MVMLLVMGLVVLAGGLLTLVYGIPIKDFSFGNTLIVAGAMVACTGLLLVGMAMVARELRRLSRASAAPASPAPAVNWPVPPLPPAPAGPVKDAAAQRGPEPALMPLPSGAAIPSAPTRPSAPESGLRERPRAQTPDIVPEPTPSDGEAAKPRRSLLFVSSSRRERERERQRAAEAAEGDAPPPGAYSELTPPESVLVSPRREPAMPAPERGTSGPSPERRETAHPVRGASQSNGDVAPPQVEPSPEKPRVTVVKSGVVDGMAYSLFSDGSIEAEMPEGMMRFASIDELRAHLERHP